MGTCSACGYEITPGDKFCSNCGVRYEPAQTRVSPGAGSRAAAASPFDGHSASAARVDFQELTAEPGAAQPDVAARPFRAAQPPPYDAQPWPPQANGYGSSPPPEQFAPGQYSQGLFAPSRGAAASRAGYPAAVEVGRAPAPPGFSAPQAAAMCPNCGQAWTGSQACAFCGQVWGLPTGIALSPAGRRLGGHLLDGLLAVCTLGIGWLIWTLIVWAQGQTPAKQVLGMRVVRLDTRAHAGWGRMFLRDFVGKGIVWMVGSLLLGVGAVVADCWLLWDKDKQELWDKIAGTIVVNDPDKRLAPPAQPG